MGSTQTGVDMEIANTEQAAAWNGEEGADWAANAERYERSGWRTWQRFLDADLISSSDTVLDVGCGTGLSTREVARIAKEGSVLGADLSAPMLEHARERTEADGLHNVTYIQCDAQVHPFDEATFDIAISDFGSMFFGDPVAAFTNIGRALRPGGRLALVAWRELAENEWLVALREALALGRELPVPPPDAPTPFSLANPDRVRGILGAAGYEAIALQPIDEPIELGADSDDAYAFMQTMGLFRGLTQDLDESERDRARANLRQLVVEHDTGDGVLLGTAAWLITARRS